MSYKSIILLLSITSLLFSKEVSFEYVGIPIKSIDNNGKEIHKIVKREIPDICKKIPINNTMLWTGNYAHKNVPDVCKSSYINTVGKLLPIKIHDEVETYGTLEVLAFIKHMQKDDSLMLIDGRKEEWFQYRTIPGAVNIPFHYIKEREAFEFEFEDALKILDVRKDERHPLDFRYAKTIVVFCNGSWCSQSIAMIDALIELGYPEEKLIWYRGGMQSWLESGITSTRK